MTYDEINREERSACAHLFRLLHENLQSDAGRSGLKGFLSLIEVLTEDKPLWAPMTDEELQRARIYTEVAFLRDLVASGVAVDIPTFHRTRNLCTRSQRKSLLSTKPDLAIAVGSLLLVVEAKLTQRVDQEQLDITRQLADIWAQEHYEYFEFPQPPKVIVMTLGGQESKENVSWESVRLLAEGIYPENDRTRVALNAAVGTLKKSRRETQLRQSALSELFGPAAAENFEDALKSADEDIASASDQVNIPLQQEYYPTIIACIEALLGSEKLRTGTVRAEVVGNPILQSGIEGQHAELFRELIDLVTAHSGAYFTGTVNLGIRAKRQGIPDDVSICTIYPARGVATFLMSRGTRREKDAVINPA